jgi:hypothetical protein
MHDKSNLTLTLQKLRTHQNQEYYNHSFIVNQYQKEPITHKQGIRINNTIIIAL